MSDLSWQEDVTPVVRQLRWIIAALVNGAVFFLVIMLVTTPKGPAQAGPPVLTFTAMAFGVICLIVRAVVPGRLTAASRRKILQGTWKRPMGAVPPWLSDEVLARAGDAAKLWQAYLTQTIVAVGVLEGATFFLLVAYMSEGSLLGLIAAGLLILAMLAHVPTRARVVRWTEGQLRQLQQQRQFGQ